MSRFNFLIALLLLPLAFLRQPEAIAQVTSAGDSTGTIVNQDGSNFGITGGSVSGDGSNLFHNFADFNLNSNQSATFFTNRNIQNILAKISGGNPSYSDGLLSVSGSNANLFLLNPSGIILGSNAQLNLGGDFTASTASGLGFGNKIWTNSADYATLTGSPTQFIFDGTGAIINAADLSVTQGQSINLFASNVVNTGSLSAEQGNIQIVAVPDSNTLRLSQTGQILNLEFASPSGNLSMVDLPALLTGSGVNTGLSINSNGEVILDANQAIISAKSGGVTITGDLDVSGATGGNIDVFGANIALVDANLEASGVGNGGKIRIGGDYQGQGILPHAVTTAIAATSILNASSTDHGDGGEIIVWSDERTDFDGYLYAKGGVNGGDGGFAEISSKGTLDLAAGWSQRVSLAAPNGVSGKLLLDPTDISIQSGSGSPISGSPTSDSLLLDSDIASFLNLGQDLEITTAGGAGGGVGDIAIASGITLAWSSLNSLTLTADNDIQASGVNFNSSGGGSLFMTAGGDVVVGDLELTPSSGNAGSLEIATSGGGISTGKIITSSSQDGGDVTLNAVGDIQVDYIDTRSLATFGAFTGGSVDIDTSGFFRATGSSLAGFSIHTQSAPGASGNGNIDITHGGNETTPFIVGDSSVNGTFGKIVTGGGVEILPTESFLADYSIGNITITTGSSETFDDDSCPPDCGDDKEDSDQEEISDDYADKGTAKMNTDVEEVQGTLKAIATQSKINPVIIYALFRPRPHGLNTAANKGFQKAEDPKASAKGETQWEFRGDRLTDFLNSATTNFLNPRETLNDDDELELVMITATGKVIRRQVPGATRAQVMQEAQRFLRSITNPRLQNIYLSPAQYLYNVLVRPLEADLEAEKVGNLAFVMDDGLRALPLAALHDGKQFLIEKYSVGLMPSFSLTNTSTYVEPKTNLLLAMGASEFTNETNLPAAPLEAQLIDDIWQDKGDVLLNQQFTVANLVEARRRKPYGILHLATHGEFTKGSRTNSYIVFQDQNVSLDQLDKLQLKDPPLELLVLSACKTAIGDRSAELGFAGLALASGAKSAMGSIWYVSDAGTMGLMTRFYEELQTSPIKAEALRQAQLALLHGEIYQEGMQLLTKGEPISLPPELATTTPLNLSHPYFWSGFTIVGNPW